MAATLPQSMPSLWQLLPQGLCAPQFQQVAIRGIALDSRKLTSGDLFLAVAGRTQDGRRFIAEAINKGCAAIVAEGKDFDSICPQPSVTMQALKAAGIPLVLVDDLEQEVSAIAARFYGEPGSNMTVFGVTGTNGKTTCASLISQLNALLGGMAGLIGTLGYGTVTASGMALTATGMTTPDAVKLQEILAQLRDAGATAVAMEVSSHSLDQHRVDAAGIDYAIFTNLSRDHLEYHGDEQRYGAAKAMLFSLPGIRAAIINADDAFGGNLLRQIPERVATYSYGLAAGADIRAANTTFSAAGISADIITPWGSGRLNSPLLGEFNLHNLLAVVAAVCASGADFAAVLAAIPRLKGVSGRMEVVAPGSQPNVVVDYAHTPDALEKALKSLRSHCNGKLWCVFGCGGDRDAGKRPIMGAVAETCADHVVVTSDNPRSEAAEAIVADIVTGIAQPEKITIEVDRLAAIRFAISHAAAEDSVLIAGKGHESYQEIAGQKYPFSDQLEARKLLTAAGCGGDPQ